MSSKQQIPTMNLVIRFILFYTFAFCVLSYEKCSMGYDMECSAGFHCENFICKPVGYSNRNILAKMEAKPGGKCSIRKLMFCPSGYKCSKRHICVAKNTMQNMVDM